MWSCQGKVNETTKEEMGKMLEYTLQTSTLNIRFNKGKKAYWLYSTLSHCQHEC